MAAVGKGSQLHHQYCVLRTAYRDLHPGPSNVPYRSPYGWPRRRASASAHSWGVPLGLRTRYGVRGTRRGSTPSHAHPSTHPTSGVRPTRNDVTRLPSVSNTIWCVVSVGDVTMR